MLIAGRTNCYSPLLFLSPPLLANGRACWEAQSASYRPAWRRNKEGCSASEIQYVEEKHGWTYSHWFRLSFYVVLCRALWQCTERGSMAYLHDNSTHLNGNLPFFKQRYQFQLNHVRWNTFIGCLLSGSFWKPLSLCCSCYALSERPTEYSDVWDFRYY